MRFLCILIMMLVPLAFLKSQGEFQDIIQARYEHSGNHSYYWIEAESFVKEEAYYGSFKYRASWTRKKTALPNDSMGCSLMRPQTQTPGEVRGRIILKKPGQYNFWMRIGTFKPYGNQKLSINVNNNEYNLNIPADDNLLQNAFSWIKISSESLSNTEIKIQISNAPNPKNETVIDCFLITDDLNYTPAKELPRYEYYSIESYNGPLIEASIWHPKRLDTPVYICRNSTQQFLLCLKNFSDREIDEFQVRIIAPKGISILDPSRKLRWSGDNRKFKSPPFIAGSPSSFTTDTSASQYEQVILNYSGKLKSYNLYDKVSSLTFITFKADETVKEGKYQIIIEAIDPKNMWKGTRISQELCILPELNAKSSPAYSWGIDSIYFSFLSETEQSEILNSLSKAGINICASRIRANDPLLARRNQELWKLVKTKDNMEIIIWSEWFWPGSPYTDESKEYIEKHPRSSGVARNDDRGQSLAGKLICPTYLESDPEENYLDSHIKQLCKIMNENQINEYLEDVEYSSPLSFCFCERCKSAFCKFSSLNYDAIKDMSGDQIIQSKQKQWIEFRTYQNTKIIEKISRLMHNYSPQVKFKLFCGYQSEKMKTRYGVDWAQLLPLKYVKGAFIGGGMPGTPAQINQIMQICQSHDKEFLSMTNATLSFPNGFDELRLSNQSDLEARIIHDLMCGSKGMFIWWWGTLDGRCLKAFETASKLSSEYADVLLYGQHKSRKIGSGNDFYMLTTENDKLKLICLVNTAVYAEDIILNPNDIMNEFEGKTSALNLLTSQEESLTNIEKLLKETYRPGTRFLWLIRK